MDRYKIFVQYDGTNFSGWQLQKEGRTIQGVLENRIMELFKSKARIRVFGSGRTDTGVHAWEQVAHVDLESNLNQTDLKNAINSRLPDDCKIIKLKKTNRNFHARYDAKKRHYRYQCYMGKSILFRNQCWIINSLNLIELNQISNIIIGNHDFLSFSKYRKEYKNTFCTIYNCGWHKDGELITFTINANRFLHHMIRYLVGTMVAICQNRTTLNHFKSLLDRPAKEVKIFKAPPQGLILEKIDFD